MNGGNIVRGKAENSQENVCEKMEPEKKNIENLKNHFLIVGHFAKGKFSTFSK